MDPDLFRKPLEIESYVHRTFSNVDVTLNPEQREVQLGIPINNDLTRKVHLTVLFYVLKENLSDVINRVSHGDMNREEGTSSLLGCTRLTGWDEVEQRERKPLFKLRQKVIEETRYVVNQLPSIEKSIEKTAVQIGNIGKAIPDNAQTILMGLTAVTIATLSLGRFFWAPAQAVSFALRWANVGVLVGHLLSQPAGSAREFRMADLVIYLLAMNLLFIRGPFGIIASGLLSCVPETLVRFPRIRHWLGLERHRGREEVLANLGVQLTRPKSKPEALAAFYLPTDKEPTREEVRAAYADKMKRLLCRLGKPRQEGNDTHKVLVEDDVEYVHEAYTLLTGEPPPSESELPKKEDASPRKYASDGVD